MRMTKAAANAKPKREMEYRLQGKETDTNPIVETIVGSREIHVVIPSGLATCRCEVDWSLLVWFCVLGSGHQVHAISWSIPLDLTSK